jgi:hypothetical protein
MHLADIVSADPDYVPNEIDFASAETMFEMDGYQAIISLRRGMDDSAFLYWSDGVANDWCEHYPTLSQGFARLAILLECCERPDRGFFAQTPKSFIRGFEGFAEMAIL